MVSPLGCCGKNCGIGSQRRNHHWMKPQHKKNIRLAAARKEARNRPFEQKKSYKWVEALTLVEKLVSQQTRVIHVFDREGDVTEVFDKTRQLQHTGVLVRAAHNRSLDSNSERLWSKLEAQPIIFEQEIELPPTQKRTQRQTKLAIRFCAINLRTPYRFDNRDPLPVYAVYATEVDCPEGETPEEVDVANYRSCCRYRDGFDDFSLVLLSVAS
jgi:hypothetical protein